MSDKVLPILATAGLVLAIASVVRTQHKHSVTPPPTSPARSIFEHRVAAVGIVEPASENIHIATPISGVVVNVFVTPGQRVKKGDPLIKLDTRALHAALAERQADLAARQSTVVATEARISKANVLLSENQKLLKFAESLSDTRSISAEELTRRQSAVEIAQADLRIAQADLAAASSSLVVAKTSVQSVETDLRRSVIEAPLDATILQTRIKPGEFVVAGSSSSSWMVLGDLRQLRLRVDVDEHEAWRIQPQAKAIAQVKGNSNIQSPISFVRFEPLIVPKVSLTGSSTERVDTRVLQAIYKIESTNIVLFVGQQMDVFIEAKDPTAVPSTNAGP